MAARLAELGLVAISVLGGAPGSDSFLSAIAQSPLSCGQGRRDVTSTVALRSTSCASENSSIALRISQETGTSSRAAILSNFSICSGLSRYSGELLFHIS